MRTMAFKRIGQLTLHYQLEGKRDGLPLVFLNSLGSDYRIWDKIVPAFSQTHPIIRYDKRGHGLSDAPAAPYSLREHSNDLKGLVEHLGLQKVILIGISVGGMIALDFAAQNSEKVHAMILSDTGMKLGSSAFWNERVEKVRQEGLLAYARPILSRWFTKNISKDEYQGYFNMLTRTPKEGYIGTCEAIRDADLRDVATTVMTRTLVMTGAQDESTPPELGRALATSLPNASFELVEGAGHFPCIEQPEKTIELISQFLKGVSS